MKSVFFKLFKFLIVFFSFIFATSCEIGLGDAVDTEPPKITVDYPETNSKIRDTFLMSGTCEDETGVARIEVLFTDTEDSLKVHKFTDEKPSNKKHTWEISVNPFESNMLDGTYKVEVTAVDNANRITKTEKTYIIDNTPPVLILSNPGTVFNGSNLTDASKFGAQIKIDGEAYDTNSIKTLTFAAYDPNTNEKKGEIVKENVSTTLGITLSELLKSSDEGFATNFYNQIYGDVSENAETKYFKFDIILSDGTSRYPGKDVETDEDKIGNTSTGYYIEDEVYQPVKSKYSIVAEDIYKIFNGTFKNSSDRADDKKIDEAKKAEIEKLLKEPTSTYFHKSTVSGDTVPAPVGIFSLNPNNNPSYKISTFEPFDSSKTWKDYSISQTGAISIVASVGLSNSPLNNPNDKDNPFKVRVFEVDDNGIRLSTAKDIVIPCTWEKSGTGYNGRIVLSNTYVDVAKKYGIELDGTDQDNLPFYNKDQIYRFLIQANSTPPKIEITHVDGLDIVNSIAYVDGIDRTKDIEISGTAESRSGAENGKVTVYPQINDEKPLENLKFTTVSNSDKTWTLKIPVSYFTKDDGYSITIHGYDEIFNENTALLTINYDTEKPVVDTFTVSPIVDINKRGYVNGKIRIDVAISDNNLSVGEGKLRIYKKESDGTRTQVAIETIQKTTLREYWFDTTKNSDGASIITDNQDLIIEVEAIDKAGHKTTDEYKYDDDNYLVVNQETDKPKLIFSNTSEDADSEDKVNKSTNLFDTAGNNKLLGTVTDDDGVDTLQFYYSDSAATEWKPLGEAKTFGGKTSANFTVEFPSELKEGIYKIYYELTDYKANKNGLDSVTTKGKEFYIGIDSGDPLISVTNQQNSYLEANTSGLNVSGTVSDGNGGVKIYRYSDTKKNVENGISIYGNAENKVEIKNINTNGIWTDSIRTLKDGDTLVYLAEDRFGRTRSVNYSFKVDSLNPTVAVTKPVEGEKVYIGTTLSSIYQFSGTAEDPTVSGGLTSDSSGIEKIKYSYTDKNSAKKSEVVSGLANWSANIDLSDCDSSEPIEFWATDNSGKDSEKVSRSVVVDSVLPKFENIKVVSTNSGSEINDIDKVYYVKNGFKIKGNLIEENFESLKVGEIEVTRNPDDYSFSYDVNSPANGQTEFNFVAKDKAGQVSSYRVTVYCDKTSPTVEITSVTPQVTANSKENNVNGKITLTGTASDDDKVSHSVLVVSTGSTTEDSNSTTTGIIGTVSDVEVTNSDGSVKQTETGFTNADGTSIKWSDVITKTEYANGGMRYKYEIDTTKFTDKSALTLKIKTTDRAGNEKSVEKALYIDQSTDIPTLTSSNMNVAAAEYKDNLFGMGSKTIYITATDDDGVQTVHYKIEKVVSTGSTTTETGSSTTGTGSTETRTVVVEENLVTGGTSTVVSKEIKLPDDFSGKYEITFTVTDINGTSYKTNAVKFAVDDDAPIISNIKINTTPDADTATYVDYTENMFIPKDYKIQLRATDSNGISKVSELDSDLNSSGEDKFTTNKITTDKDGDVIVTVTAYDSFGRSSSQTLKMKVDTGAPKWGKDINQIESDTTIKGGQKKITHNELTETTWFNSDAITLSGNAYDENGIAEYVLKIGSKDPTTSSSGYTYGIVATYDQGNNSVTLRAKDPAGNFVERTLSINVDTEAPVLDEVKVLVDDVENSAEKYINGSKTVKLIVKSTDATSKVGKILISDAPSFNVSNGFLVEKVVSTSSTTTDTGSTTETIDITEQIKTWTDGTKTLYVKVLDNAENESAQMEITDFKVDTKAPKFSCTSHTNNKEVNKSIDLSGSVTEDYFADTPDAKLYYRVSTGSTDTGTSSSWTESSATVDINTTNKTWSVVDFNTELLNDNTSYDFQIRMTDKTGNITPDTDVLVTLKVNQNSDRPVIKLNTINPESDTNRLSSGEFAGTIEDDDGTVKKLYFQAVPAKSSYEDVDSKWKTLDASTNSWALTEDISLSDGNYTLYFKVIDARDTTFITRETDGLNVPYMQYPKGKKCYAPVKFSVDTEKPEINSVKYSVNGSSYDNDLGDFTFSKIKDNKISFMIVATDSVSEKLTVKVKFFGTEYTATKEGSEYFIKDIDLGITSAKSVVEITASDEGGLPADPKSYYLTIDNTAPNVIKNVAPSSSTEITGNFEMTGLVEDASDGSSGIPISGAMWYYIPKYAEKDIEASTVAMSDWIQITSQSSSTWSIDFSKLADTIDYNSEKETVSTDYSGYEDSTNKGIYDIPVWFKIKDNADNIGYIKGNSLHYNPNADKPIVEIVYPGESEKETSGENTGKIVMGGTARFQGTASDNEGIAGVYLQFDFNDDGIYENGEDVTGLKSNSDGKVYIGGDESNIAKQIPNPNTTEYGFKAKGTVSWSTLVDISGIEGKIKVRAIAVDSDSDKPLVSAWSKEIEIVVNNEMPQINSAKLVKYKDSSYSEFEKEIDYTEGTYISGSNWRLECTASHEKGIESVSVDSSNSVTCNDSTNTEFYIPINSESSWKVELTVTDIGETPHPKIQTYSVNIDNDAPKFVGTGNTLVVCKDNYNTSTVLSEDVVLQNSNGEYVSIISKVNEAGSGFNKAFFYFQKEKSDKTDKRIYNIMKQNGRISLKDSKTENSVYINDQGLPAYYVASVGRSSETSIELTTKNDNIRNASYVKIAGEYHKITNVSSTSVTIADNVDTTYNTNVEFIYAIAVDNSGESRDYSGNLKNDDGDEIIENISKIGSEITWEAAIPSANIPDGPVQLHVVAFDNAGNSVHSSVYTKISNNAPRITSVKLGTDLNGNNDYEETEYEQFYALQNQNRTVGVEIWELDTKKEMGTKNRWTAKKGLSVIPEFVGGNAPYYYVFTKPGTDTSITTPVKNTDANLKNAQITGYTEVKDSDGNVTSRIANAINFTNDEIKVTGENSDITYQFSFWDSTEETTAGVDSSWTILNAKVHQDLEDDVEPKGYIKPFYWNSLTDNSVEKTNPKKVSDLQGHIELEDDWKNASGNDNKTSGTYLDSDPKVSGKIIFEGLIYDNVLLKSFSFNFADFGDIKISDYASGSWSAFTATDKITRAEVRTVSLGQSGHVAKYTVVVDTSKITNVADKDQSATIKVTDAADKTYTSTAGTLTKNTVSKTLYATEAKYKAGEFYTDTSLSTESNFAGIPEFDLVEVENSTTEQGVTTYKQYDYTGYYRMDVVPYITGVDTSLSSIKKGNPSVNTRTSLGHYPVRADETVSIEGFNLNSDGSIVSKKISELTTSTKFSIFVNGIESLNNKNNDDSKGAYTEITSNSVGDFDIYNNYYNRQPNDENNNLLTDDIYFDIWQFDSEAVKPISGKVEQPVMKIDPKTDALGFAFANGALYYSMGGTINNTTYSSIYWMGSYDAFTSIGFAYDDLGYTYGSAAGGDSNANEGDAYCFVTSRWGLGALGQRGSYDGANTLRLERISHIDSAGVKTITRQRVMSPSFVTTVHDSKTTNVYLAYYDSVNDEIRFKSGSTSSTSKSGFGMFTDSATISGGTTRSENVKYVNLLAGGNTGRNAGDYVSIGVKKGANSTSDVIVAVWYDQTSKALKYAYNNKPLASAMGASSGSEWLGEETVFSGDQFMAGEYCQVIVDKDGGIHIAAYDPVNLDLVYAYKSSYDITGFNTCVVDSNGVVGSNLTLDVAKVDNVWVPYIGYYATSIIKPKLAYKVSSGVVDPGSIDDFVTNSWNLSVVPTQNRIDMGNLGNNKMNVGIWKNIDDWVIKSSKKGEKKSTHTNKGYSSDCNDLVWGNGTQNPIMGYSIKLSGTSSYIETAQLK